MALPLARAIGTDRACVPGSTVPLAKLPRCPACSGAGQGGPGPGSPAGWSQLAPALSSGPPDTRGSAAAALPRAVLRGCREGRCLAFRLMARLRVGPGLGGPLEATTVAGCQAP